MMPRRCSHNLIACATVLFASLAVHLDVRAADPSAPEAGDPGKMLAEIFLALDRKGDLEAIEREFAAVGITQVRPNQFSTQRLWTNDNRGTPFSNTSFSDRVRF